MSTDVRWRPVVGFEGFYEVSDDGRVRSLYGRGRLLATERHPGGYPVVHLCLDGKGRKAKLHRLVMAAFVGPLPEGMVTRHLDGDPTNNTLANLTYGTQSENMLDASRHGTHHGVIKTHCPSGHPYDEVNTVRFPSRPRFRCCRTCRNSRKKVTA